MCDNIWLVRMNLDYFFMFLVEMATNVNLGTFKTMVDEFHTVRVDNVTTLSGSTTNMFGRTNGVYRDNVGFGVLHADVVAAGGHCETKRDGPNCHTHIYWGAPGITRAAPLVQYDGQQIFTFPRGVIGLIAMGGQVDFVATTGVAGFADFAAGSVTAGAAPLAGTDIDIMVSAPIGALVGGVATTSTRMEDAATAAFDGSTTGAAAALNFFLNWADVGGNVTTAGIMRLSRCDFHIYWRYQFDY